MDFQEYTKKINDFAANYQKEPEYIDDVDVAKAIYYLNNIYIEQIGDCLIFLSALNLCNAYVKQSKSKIGYRFKKGIEYFIETINNRKIKDLYINCTQNNGMLYIFQVANLQFSFHDEKKVTIENSYLKELTWDGIKKQPCAKTIFNMAIQNKILVTNKTYRGKNLEEKVKRTEENYLNGKITIEELIRN